jgi:hypothetical protein
VAWQVWLQVWSQLLVPGLGLVWSLQEQLLVPGQATGSVPEGPLPVV